MYHSTLGELGLLITLHGFTLEHRYDMNFELAKQSLTTGTNPLKCLSRPYYILIDFLEMHLYDKLIKVFFSIQKDWGGILIIGHLNYIPTTVDV